VRYRHSLHPAVSIALALSIASSLAAPALAGEFEKIKVKSMYEDFQVGPPLTYTPFRGTTAVSETTIRHQVFFNDFEASTAGWNVIDFKAGQPNAWHLVTGGHSCVGNAWWCGQTGYVNGDGYDNNWVQKLVTNVPITLNGTTGNSLTFKYRCQSEYGFDYGWVLMRGSNPGAKWDTLASYSGNFGASCNNATVAIKDSFTTVTQPVVLMFLFASDLTVATSDSAGAFTGFSVDDVKITASGNNVRFIDDMETGTSKWVASSPDPGTLWHLETAPGTSIPASCFFLSTNLWVPFAGSGYGLVPDFADAMLTSPPMDIQGVFSPNNPVTLLRVQFDNWVNLPLDNSMYWSLWVQGSHDQVTWTPWRNATGWSYSVSNATCYEGTYKDFDPYYTFQTGIQPGTPFIRLGFRIRDQKATTDDPGPLRIGYMTEGIYFDDIGVYHVYTISGVEPVPGIPTGDQAAIRRVFPNPFNPKTKIEFSVPKVAPVAVRIFDIQGKLVSKLVDDRSMAPGVYQVAWNGKSDRGQDMPSGLYFAQIRSGASRQSVRLTMLK
jgi:flagellar hook capping protein FlgD